MIEDAKGSRLEWKEDTFPNPILASDDAISAPVILFSRSASSFKMLSLPKMKIILPVYSFQFHYSKVEKHLQKAREFNIYPNYFERKDFLYSFCIVNSL